MVNKTGVNRNTKRQPHWNGKNPAQIPDAAPRSRVALDPVAYDNLIKQHGVRVKVYRSMFCPNVKSVDGGEHNIDCTLCNGSGYLDVDPIESVAYLANQNFQEEMTVEGYHDGNSVGGTFLGGVELQYFTRVDLMDFTQPFYERVLRRADSNPGTNGIPDIPATFGTGAEIQIILPVFADSIPADEGAVFNMAFGVDGFFEVTQDPADTTLDELVIGHRKIFADMTIPFLGQEGRELSVSFANIGNGHQFAASLRDFINGPLQTTQTVEQANRIGNPTTTAPTVRARCTARIVGSGTDSGPVANRTLILTKTAIGSGNPIMHIENFNNEGAIGSVLSSGTDPTVFVPSQIATNQSGTQDNLKYDCKRVNVIIDKTGNQYHQDIDFKLTAQGNIEWLRQVAADGTTTFVRSPGDGVIYTVHYESVIQYRAISAMHINRFAQVPDKSTGLVAQVKMPEQWMLQKEFLIIRRDEYGKEIKKTGIFGDIIANQPFNPAPADSL